jgi:hypothetical protein
MVPAELVVDEQAFLALARECQEIFDIRKRLPDFVFRRSWARYYAIEHVHIHDFGAFLFNLSNAFHDEAVHYMTLEPDPVEYYHRYCSFFGAATFRPSDLPERYRPVMFIGDGSASTFLVRGGDVGVFWGSSLKWGIFCDRISWEMAVIAVSEDVDVPKLADFRCMDASFLEDYMMGQWAKDTSVALDFTKRFLANYEISH